MALETNAEIMRLIEKQQKELESLKKKHELQHKEFENLKSVHEIQNIMSRYVYLHEVNRDSEFPEIFYAKKTPGVSAEVANFGVFVGSEGLKKMFTTPPEKRDTKGLLYFHPLTTPCIEVAADGKTAKGLWNANGYETGKNPKTGALQANFAYTKYACDFVKEDDIWKVWHYHVYRVFMTPFGIPWTEEWEAKQEVINRQEIVNRPKIQPDLPTTYDHPYSTTTERELVPAPPDPYETFDQTFSYGP